MGLFNRKISPDFIAVPAEPGLQAVEDQVEAVDRQLRLYANTPGLAASPAVHQPPARPAPDHPRAARVRPGRRARDPGEAVVSDPATAEWREALSASTSAQLQQTQQALAASQADLAAARYKLSTPEANDG